MAQVERDFPVGHPKAADTVLGSAEHIRWVEGHKFLENARDFPPGHPKAADTPGNLNTTEWKPGEDPHNPHLEPFTGLQPERAAAKHQWEADESAGAHESPVLEPIDADIANAALAAERKALKVDSLTAEQHQAVIARLQNAAQSTPTPAVDLKQQAIAYVMTHGYDEKAATSIVEENGVDTILASKAHEGAH